MKIAELLKSYEPKSKANSERAALIEQFVEELQRERPIEARLVAIKLSHIKELQHLWQFLSMCKDYKNRHGSFGKAFWGALKLK